MRRIALHNLCRLLIAVLPPIGALFLTGHVGLLLIGVSLRWSELAFSHSLFDTIMWVVSSLAFEFCWIHRAFIVYCYVVSLAIDYQSSIGFGSVTLYRWITFLVGIGLFSYFIGKGRYRVLFKL